MDQAHINPDNIFRITCLIQNNPCLSNEPQGSDVLDNDSELVSLEAFCDEQKLKITAAVFVKDPPAIIVGTASGSVCEYILLSEKGDDSKPPKTKIFKGISVLTELSNKPVKKLIYVETHRILLALVGKNAHAFVYPHLTPVLARGSKVHECCTDFFYYEDQNLEEYVFFDSKSLLFCSINANGLSILRKLEYNNIGKVQCSVRMGSKIILGFRDGYACVDLGTLEQYPLLTNNDSTQKPIIVQTGSNELLLVVVTDHSTFMGVLVDKMGDPTRGTINWSSPALSIQLWNSCIFTLLMNSVVVIHNLNTLSEIEQIVINPKVEPFSLIAFSHIRALPGTGVVLVCRNKIYIINLKNKLMVLEKMFKAGDYTKAVLISKFFLGVSDNLLFYSDIHSKVLLKVFREYYSNLNIKRAFKLLHDTLIDPRISLSLLQGTSSLFKIPTVGIIKQTLLSNSVNVKTKKLSVFNEFTSLPLASFLPDTSLDDLIASKYNKDSDDYKSYMKSAMDELCHYMYITYKKVKPGLNNQNSQESPKMLFSEELGQVFPDIPNDPQLYTSFVMFVRMWEEQEYAKAISTLKILPVERFEECIGLMEACDMWYLRSKFYELVNSYDKCADGYLMILSGRKVDKGFSIELVMKEFKNIIKSMDSQSARKYTLELSNISKEDALDILLNYEKQLISDECVGNLVMGNNIWKVTNSEGCIDNVNQFINYIEKCIETRNDGDTNRYTILIEAMFKKASIILRTENMGHSDRPEVPTDFKLESEYLKRSDKSLSFVEFMKGKGDLLSLVRLELIDSIEKYFTKYDINKVYSVDCSLPGFWEEKARLLKLQELWFPAIETAMMIENYDLADKICLTAFEKVDNAEKCKISDFFLPIALEKYHPESSDSFISSLLVRYSRYLSFLETLCNLPGTINPKVFKQFASLGIQNKLNSYLCDSIGRELCIKDRRMLLAKMKSYSQDSIILDSSNPECTKCGQKINLSEAKIIPSMGVVHDTCAP